MRATLVLPVVGAAVVTAGALMLRLARRAVPETPGTPPRTKPRSQADPDLREALPDRLRARGL